MYHVDSDHVLVSEESYSDSRIVYMQSVPCLGFDKEEMKKFDFHHYHVEIRRNAALLCDTGLLVFSLERGAFFVLFSCNILIFDLQLSATFDVHNLTAFSDSQH